MVRDIFAFIICHEILHTYRYFYINYKHRVHLHVPLFISSKIYLTMGHKILKYYNYDYTHIMYIFWIYITYLHASFTF